jgi:hypothetical protein
LNLFSASVMGRCNAASNTTVWDGNYYNSCIKCDILIRGSFNKPAYYFIQIFSEFHHRMNPVSLFLLSFYSYCRYVFGNPCCSALHWSYDDRSFLYDDKANGKPA